VKRHDIKPVYYSIQSRLCSKSILIFLLFQVFLFLPSIFAEENNKIITAVPVSTSIKLDGIPNETVWENAVPISNFTQKELIEGASPTEKTEVKAVYNEKNLYFSVKCYDKEPDKIIHNELKWDGDIESDDNFTVVLDTFNDQRTGFYFSVNPNGARLDALIKSVEEINDDWNGVWDVAAQITDYGWSAEIVIPFLTLRFPDAEIQNWGINFSRKIRRKNEEVLWTAWKRDDGILQISRAGKLAGVKNIRRGKHTEFTQYPEKREFFLEGAETFDFTQGGTKMYYSRRIGITPDPDRQEVPILGGMKLSGKTGSYRFGVMSIQTEKIVIQGDTTKNVHPSANYTVVRIKKDVLKESYIGFIGSSVHRTDTPNTALTGIESKDRFFNKRKNLLGGVDFAYNTSTFLKNKNFTIQGYFAATKTPGLSGDNIAGRVFIDYPNDKIDTYLLYHGIDKNFNPEIGFVSRTGIQHLSTLFRYMPRPGLPYVKKFLFKPYEINYVMDTHTKLLTRALEFRPFGILFETDDELEFNIQNHYEYLDYKHTIYKEKDKDVVINIGSYDWWNYEIKYESLKSRPVSIDLKTEWGDYYNGTRTYYKAACTFKLNKYFAFTPEAAYNDISLGDDSFNTKEVATRFTTNLSTRLTSSTFIQWNSKDNEANMNFRIHYIPSIGSDIFVVYNQLWDEEDDFRTLQNTGILKVNYLFRF